MNLSPELLSLIDCTRFAISTDGSRHNFPDPDSIARIPLADPDREKTLCFNDPQKNAAIWAGDPQLGSTWNFRVVPPEPHATGPEIHV